MTKFYPIFFNYEEERVRAFWRVLIQFVFFFFLITESPPIISGFVASDFYFEFVVEIAFLFTALATVYFSTKLLDKRNFKDLGLYVNSRWLKEYLVGFMLGASIFSLIFLIQLAAGWIKIEALLYNESGIAFLPAILIRFAGYSAVAVTEELFSRGYQLKNLAEGFNSKKLSESNSIVLAWVLSALIFGLLHAENPSANLISTFNLFLIGLFFGLTYILSGSLAIPIGLHTTWNFFQGNIFGFPVSGFEAYVSVFKTSIHTPTFVNDASFGPEAGIIIFPGLLAGIFFMVYFYKRAHFKHLINNSIVGYKAQ